MHVEIRTSKHLKKGPNDYKRSPFVDEPVNDEHTKQTKVQKKAWG